MSLLIRLDKLNKDQSITNEDKEKVFNELLLSFVTKNQFNDFKTILSYHNYNEQFLYNVLNNAIKEDAILFVKHLITSQKNKVTINFKLLKDCIIQNRVIILEYLLSQRPKELDIDKLILLTENETILKLLSLHGANASLKLDFITQQSNMLSKVTKCIETWIKNGSSHCLKLFHKFIYNYLILSCIERSKEDKSINAMHGMLGNLKKIIDKQHTCKNNFYEYFYLFLEENNQDDIQHIYMYLMNIDV